jgi:hypothetical protein
MNANNIALLIILGPVIISSVVVMLWPSKKSPSKGGSTDKLHPAYVKANRDYAYYNQLMREKHRQRIATGWYTNLIK